jgi:hypothetical protein
VKNPLKKGIHCLWVRVPTLVLCQNVMSPNWSATNLSEAVVKSCGSTRLVKKRKKKNKSRQKRNGIPLSRSTEGSACSICSATSHSWLICSASRKNLLSSEGFHPRGFRNSRSTICRPRQMSQAKTRTNHIDVQVPMQHLCQCRQAARKNHRQDMGHPLVF